VLPRLSSTVFKGWRVGTREGKREKMGKEAGEGWDKGKKGGTGGEEGRNRGGWVVGKGGEITPSCTVISKSRRLDRAVGLDS